MTDKAGIDELIASVRPHSIFHLAAYGGMPFEKDQDQVYKVNFDGTRYLYNACKKVGFDCFIHTGSSSEYGRKDKPLDENMHLEPVSDYAVAKAATTQFLLKEALLHTMPAYTVRPFSVYGPYELKTRMIPDVIQAACTGKTIAMSAPHYVRDFIYIDDMVSCLLAVEQKRPKFQFTFNAGTGIQSTIEEVVSLVGTVIGSSVSVKWGSKESRPWEPKSWVAQKDLTCSILNWKPIFSLQEGIEKTVQWFKKRKAWDEDEQAMCSMRDGNRLSEKNC